MLRQKLIQAENTAELQFERMLSYTSTISVLTDVHVMNVYAAGRLGINCGGTSTSMILCKAYCGAREGKTS